MLAFKADLQKSKKILSFAEPIIIHMKKSFLLTLASLFTVAAAASVICIRTQNNSRTEDPLFNANVEALINGESSLDVDCAESEDHNCRVVLTFSDGTQHAYNLPNATRTFFIR